MLKLLCPAALAALAGSAAAQPVVDGKMSTAEMALYGHPLFTQTDATHFGDNSFTDTNCDPNTLGGDPSAATTGMEFQIPLSELGNPTGTIKILAFLNSGGHSNITNQTLPGLPAHSDIVGNPRATTLNIGYATVSATTGTDPVCDGTLDAAYGTAKALQTNRTSANDNTDNSGNTGNGSELDGLYAVVRDGTLYIMVTGNMASDFGHKIELFIDNGSGLGYNQLTQSLSLPNVDFGALQAMQGDGTNAGLKFPAGFQASQYFTFGLGNSPATYYPNIADLVANYGQYLGNNTAGSGSGDLGQGGDIQIAMNNGNIAGVAATCPNPNGDVNKATGSEIDALYAYVDQAHNRLYMLVTGNIESNYNSLELFFDAQPGGQNTLRTDNPDNDFNGLNRMGGLTFDAGFEADYWLSIRNGNDGQTFYANACVLRTDGPRDDGNGNHVDYGSYDGSDNKNTYNPIMFGVNGDSNHDRLDIQDGFTAQVYSNYAPRLAGDSLALNNSSPTGTPGLVMVSLDNSNIYGVTGDSGDCTAADQVMTGVELSIDLNELGWDGSSPILVAGFINGGGHGYVSNQIIGGLPPGTDNLGDPVGVNFGTLPGVHYVQVTNPCPADFNGDGFPDFFDFNDFVNCFEGISCPPGRCADFNADGFADFFDFSDFVTAFENGC